MCSLLRLMHAGGDPGGRQGDVDKEESSTLVTLPTPITSPRFYAKPYPDNITCIYKI